MITVLNKKTNELVGFGDATSKDEIRSAMKGYNYGEVSTHKPTFYERHIQPTLDKMGADIAQPKFVYSKPTPTALRAFTTSAVRDASFGAIQDRGQMQRFTAEEQAKFPVQSFLGSLTGQTGAIIASSGVAGLLKMPTIAGWAGNIINKASQAALKLAPSLTEAKVGAKAIAIAKQVGGGAVQAAKTGAVYGGVRESVTQLNEEEPSLEKVGKVMLKDSAAFALYGATGAGIPSKAAGTATIAGLGYFLSKADGASEEDAILNGGVMGMFHLVSAHADTPEIRKKVLNDTEDILWGYLRAKSPIMANSVAGKTANEIKLRAVQEVVQEVPQISRAVVTLPNGEKRYGVSHEDALNKAGMSKKTAVEGKDFQAGYLMTDQIEITRQESIDQGHTKTGHSNEVPSLKKAQDEGSDNPSQVENVVQSKELTEKVMEKIAEKVFDTGEKVEKTEIKEEAKAYLNRYGIKTEAIKEDVSRETLSQPSEKKEVVEAEPVKTELPEAPVVEITKPEPEKGKLERGLSKSIEKDAIAEGLVKDLGDLPTYEKRDLSGKIAEQVSDFIENDYDLAKKIAMREEPEQGGLRAEELFTGIRIKALAEGDGATLLELANADLPTAIAKEMGQRIKALDTSDPRDPVTTIKALKQTKVAEVEKKIGKKKIAEEKKTEVGKIKAEIKKAVKKQDWEGFVKSLQC